MKRPQFVLVLLISMFTLSSLRMVYIIAEKETFPDVSNSLRSVVLAEQRGEIYDRNMISVLFADIPVASCKISFCIR